MREWGMRGMEKIRELTGVDEGMEDERNGKEKGVDEGSMREWGMRGMEKRRELIGGR